MARDWRKRSRCATSGKIRFSTRNQAISLAAQIGTPWMRTYECDACGHWHLTTPVERKQLARRITRLPNPSVGADPNFVGGFSTKGRYEPAA